MSPERRPRLRICARYFLPNQRLVLRPTHERHVWQLGGNTLGSATTLRVKSGTRVEFRSDCPMDFDFAQTSGPRLALGPSRMFAGTSRTIVFARRGTYRLTVKNVQSSEDRGLATLGPDNTLTLTVRVA